jgi:hypothetical protein
VPVQSLGLAEGGAGQRPGSTRKLAFDHAQILADGLERARAKLEYAPLATAFVADEFTIAELRGVRDRLGRAAARGELPPGDAEDRPGPSGQRPDAPRREAVALTRLQDVVDPALLAYFPPLVATGQRDEARSGIRRHVNLIGVLSGFRSLAEVRAPFPAGVDSRDAASMWRRLLVAIGAAHRAGVIHGAVLPEHVLIHPSDHGLVLLGSRAGRPGPGHRAALPALVPARMAAFARGCLLASPGRRPQDAWRLLAEFDEMLERLYGPRRFRPFPAFQVTMRESRDCAEHPRSLAIAVLFDVTGSMGAVPRVLQAKLPQLLGLLLRKGYAADPQIMFGAIGDASCDGAPLQVGQFESDNRMDDDLGRILLEGGGGQKTESY